jgi:hypothetical protein
MTHSSGFETNHVFLLGGIDARRRKCRHCQRNRSELALSRGPTPQVHLCKHDHGAAADDVEMPEAGLAEPRSTGDTHRPLGTVELKAGGLFQRPNGL